MSSVLAPFRLCGSPERANGKRRPRRQSWYDVESEGMRQRESEDEDQFEPGSVGATQTGHEREFVQPFGPLVPEARSQRQQLPQVARSVRGEQNRFKICIPSVLDLLFNPTQAHRAPPLSSQVERQLELLSQLQNDLVRLTQQQFHKERESKRKPKFTPEGEIVRNWMTHSSSHATCA